jgi:hypothetical protein
VGTNLRALMRDPPETTTVKAPLSAANFSERSAVYLASDAARSSSASKMSRSLFDAAAGAAPSVAMAATAGRRSVREEDRRRGRDRRVLNGTRDAGGERRRQARGGREEDAAAEAETDMEVDMCYMRGVAEVTGGG